MFGKKSHFCIHPELQSTSTLQSLQQRTSCGSNTNASLRNPSLQLYPLPQATHRISGSSSPSVVVVVVVVVVVGVVVDVVVVAIVVVVVVVVEVLVVVVGPTVVTVPYPSHAPLGSSITSVTGSFGSSDGSYSVVDGCS
mmetsp:Transcript_13983/g.28739  ORF Transcript_13983/g.28739 Transcript_13983/m.28739 type:complete len:139 (-) Transcript_13983:810-1226(-)